MTSDVVIPMLDAALVGAYGRRLGGDLPSLTLTPLPEPDARLLRLLHRRHVYSVPFENLDTAIVHATIPHDVVHAARKVCEQQRGGFCYELNGALSALLSSLGFDDVTLLSCRIWRAGREFGPPLSHVALLVCVGGTAWLCDVGNGRALVEPVAFEHGLVQAEGQDGEAYLMRRLGEGETDADGAPCKSGGGSSSSGGDGGGSSSSGGDGPAPGETWRLYELLPPSTTTTRPGDEETKVDDVCAGIPVPPGYGSLRCVMEVATSPVPFSAFAERCAATQTAADSPFTKGLVCTRRVPGAEGGALGGRVTLASGPWAGREGVAAAEAGSGPGSESWVLSERDRPGGERRITRITGLARLKEVLRERFGVVLPEEEDGRGGGEGERGEGGRGKKPS
jgi:hypothetical protein